MEGRSLVRSGMPFLARYEVPAEELQMVSRVPEGEVIEVGSMIYMAREGDPEGHREARILASLMVQDSGGGDDYLVGDTLAAVQLPGSYIAGQQYRWWFVVGDSWEEALEWVRPYMSVDRWEKLQGIPKEEWMIGGFSLELGAEVEYPPLPVGAWIARSALPAVMSKGKL